MQSFLENRRGGMISQFILWSHYKPDTETRESQCKKIKFQTDIFHAYKYKILLKIRKWNIKVLTR